MMKLAALILLLLPASSVLAESGRFSGGIAVADNYGYQGFDQDQGNTTASANLQYRLTENVSSGVWVGKYELPWSNEKSTEVDYFIGYSKQLSFNHRIETAVWHYTYLHEDYERYNWTQWLTSYHIDDRFTIALGLSDNFLDMDQSATFVEGTLRHSFGPAITALSVGRNNLSGTALESFEYVQIQTTYSRPDWSLYINYTEPLNVDSALTRMLAQDGLGLGISYRF